MIAVEVSVLNETLFVISFLRNVIHLVFCFFTQAPDVKSPRQYLHPIHLPKLKPQLLKRCLKI